MKILWVNSNFLHPTTKGGQIRTLEMLRRLHRRHEIHYVAIEDPAQPEGPARATNTARGRTPSPSHSIPSQPRFYAELVGLFSPMPVAVSASIRPACESSSKSSSARNVSTAPWWTTWRPPAISPISRTPVVPAQRGNDDLAQARRTRAGPSAPRVLPPPGGAHVPLRAPRSLAAGHIVAVSRTDADEMRKLFGVPRVSEIPTGVNIEYFPPPAAAAPDADLVFVGSMDWLPNIDGVLWFVREVLPLIRNRRPVHAGDRRADAPAKDRPLADQDARIQVTGTVPDMRPYLWGAAVSIVPLRIGGGTRLKIYEAMAAKVPVVSTTVGAEGLHVNPPHDIRIGDTPEDFAAQCLELLGSPRDSRLRLSNRLGNGELQLLLGARRPLLRKHHENRPPHGYLVLKSNYYEQPDPAPLSGHPPRVRCLRRNQTAQDRRRRNLAGARPPRDAARRRPAVPGQPAVHLRRAASASRIATRPIPLPATRRSARSI